MGADGGFGAAGSRDRCSLNGHSPALSGGQRGHPEASIWPRLHHKREGAVFPFTLPQHGSLRLETSGEWNGPLNAFPESLSSCSSMSPTEVFSAPGTVPDTEWVLHKVTGRIEGWTDG